MPAGDRCARAHAQGVFPWGKPLLSVPCRQYHCAREASEINEDAATSSTGPIAHQQRDGEIRDGNCEEGAGQEGRSEEDRKSTRLNSSHQKISYAVFCLKK